MKKSLKIFLSVLCAVAMTLPLVSFVGCGDSHVDYVKDLRLDFSTSTKKQEVTVRNYIDGDTTHFDPVKNSTVANNPSSDFAETQGYIKARYLAINTPESTGSIEPYGKAASNFTKEKLKSVDYKNGGSIVVESDKDFWDIDSTGERYLLWVWYKPTADDEYRNLNVEILQEGLAYASRTSEGIYGSTAQKALNQAVKEKLVLYSGKDDPDYYTGDIKYVSIKELRLFPKKWEGIRVSVTGTIVSEFDSSVYLEAYDEAEERYYGLSVFYGYNASTWILNILKVGHKVEIVGTFNYFETGDTYQISGLPAYDPFNPEADTNCKKLEEGIEPSFSVIDLTEKNFDEEVTIYSDVEDEDGNIIEITMPYGESLLSTSVTVQDLVVDHIYTTDTVGGKSNGAMTIYCKLGEKEVQIRTDILYKEDGTMLKAEDFFIGAVTKSPNGKTTYGTGKTITVKGIIEKYEGEYQIKVYRTDFLLGWDD